MVITENKERLVEILNEELGLTPYESKAYIALLLHGPLSPQGLNQKSGIPRPRTYDVLNSLVGKGLLMEQPGRPRMYAAVDPQVGLERMMTDLERNSLRQLEEKRKTVDKLSTTLSKLHEDSREVAIEEEKVWVTRRDSAFVARYCEAIRNVQKEFVIATPALDPPEKEVLEAVKHVLKKGKTVRVVRPIMADWTWEQLDEYEKLIKLGDQVRYLNYNGLRFTIYDHARVTIFDKVDTVLVSPAEGVYQLAVWIDLPPLADILYDYFEVLWKQAQPALPLLRKMKEGKT